MSETKITITGDIARVIFLDIAKGQSLYNEAWSWWAYDADADKSYPYGYGVVKREQFVDSDSELELILSITPDIEDDPVYFRVRGSSSSYGRDQWDARVTEVKPTERVVRIYE